MRSESIMMLFMPVQGKYDENNVIKFVSKSVKLVVLDGKRLEND